MTLALGMACTHFPSLFQETYEGWQRYWRILSSHVPQPPEVYEEDADRIASFIERRNAAFETFRKAFRAAEIDVLVVIGGDQDEWFDRTHIPNLFVYSGSDPIKGFHNYGSMDSDPPLQFFEHPDRFGLELAVHSQLAQALTQSLLDDDFDVSTSTKIVPQGRPTHGAPHAIVRPLPSIMPELDVPVLPVIIKTIENSPANMTGKRCLELGRAIGAFCARQPERIAILASGGMSHDPVGPRSGWVDEPLDRWLLDILADGRIDPLGGLFSFQSASMDSGTGELRSWLVAAAAIQQQYPGIKADILDYFPARKATAGCGWALWHPDLTPPQGGSAA
ncbi:hypothetical protein [Sphingobium phenoxybenzoativorans]|uniref:DODA-type extradiol aromatic ring-opening family dioxygenase n=1 Tax=Sphingobium phenoxybenzoativorans TaxID=1592790 RepID=UPI000872290E|nr:hypothetical protein [Sphingobium phenoxybenzoativorans]